MGSKKNIEKVEETEVIETETPVVYEQEPEVLEAHEQEVTEEITNDGWVYIDTKNGDPGRKNRAK